MDLAHRWQDRNLSKLELVVALLLIAVFIGAFSYRAIAFFALAEKSFVTSTIVNINSALRMQAAYYIIKSDGKALTAMQGMNPMNLLQENHGDYARELSDIVQSGNIVLEHTGRLPGNYKGEKGPDEISIVDDGNWYFNRDKKTLEYVVSNKEFFYSNIQGRERIRFYVDIKYDDVNNNGKFDSDVDRFRSVTLEPYDRYEWKF